MRLPSKFNGYSADGVRLYNDPATRAELDKKEAAKAKAPPTSSQITELTNNYNNRVKELNTDFTNRLKDTNTDFANRIKDTQTEYQNRIRDLQKEFAQRTKDEDAELRSIKNAKERAEKQKEFNEARKNRAAELAGLQKEMPARIAELQKEQKTTITNINNEKTTTLKDLATAFNDTKNYVTTALQRGESPSLDMMTAAQRKQQQDEAAARAQAEAQARAQAEAQARAQAEAAKQAQMQQYIKEAEQISQQRKSQNYAQMYNMLTSNMPIPVGYQQPATSRQAQTTMIGAGGEDQGIMRPQMSPAQLAQLASMNRGAAYAPPSQSVQQGTQAQSPNPVPAKRGGIMGKF
jgi:DNA repair exonuclease SbcCD ATPase subunit